MPRRESDLVDPIHLGGFPVKPLNPGMSDVDESETLAPAWAVIAEAFGVGEPGAQYLETKAMGMTRAESAEALGWPVARLNNVAKATQRAIADSNLKGQRQIYSLRKANSLKMVYRERLDYGGWCYSMDFMGDEFRETMATEAPQVVEHKNICPRKRFLTGIGEGTMQHSSVQFELKQIDETGTFTGLLSPYGPPADLGSDIVQPGAYNKTLQENRGRVPLLLDHNPSKQVGVLELTDSPQGLQARGILNMDLSLAQETRSRMAFNLKNGVKTGLSIGFQSMKEFVADGVRYLKEIKLYEGSITLFPMAPAAQVSSVKSAEQQQALAAAVQKYLYEPVIRELDKMHKEHLKQVGELAAKLRGRAA